MAQGIYAAPWDVGSDDGNGVILLDIRVGDTAQIARVSDPTMPDGMGISFWWVRGGAALITLHEALAFLDGWTIGLLGALAQIDVENDTLYLDAVQVAGGYTDNQMLVRANRIMQWLIDLGRPATLYVTKPTERKVVLDMLAAFNKDADWLRQAIL